MIIIGIILGFLTMWFFVALAIDFLGIIGLVKTTRGLKENFGIRSFLITLFIFANLLFVGMCER